MSEHAQKSKSHGAGLLRIILIVAVVGGGIWLWEDVVEDRVFPKRFGIVEDGAVYRSGQLHPALVERTLAKHGIERIVSLGADTPGNAEHEAEIAAAKKLGIARETYSLGGDGTGDINDYAGAIRSIVRARNEGTPILVHCAAGAQRTGGVIAMYRLLVQGASPPIVLDEMTDYDWDPDDDRILVEYLDEHMQELAESLRRQGIIESVPAPLPKLAEHIDSV